MHRSGIAKQKESELNESASAAATAEQDKFWQSYSCDALPHPQNHTAAPDRSLLTAPSPACFPRTRASGIPVYYINADKDVQRRADMEKQLERLGLPYRRIAAITPQSDEYRVGLLEQPCKRNTPTDLAVVMSHLKALYSAVHEPLLLPRSLSTTGDSGSS
eukprot:CAMPEP_0173325912 /NCGR_PEP_ID=MMETSP1144-20121109/782_1 /TAXON_ID=483371 /ORGANISM="non described non described, Strain CCMP2298" /LENGTH=160 /DNA_ID=CAMNT_0014270181 /DNA_START=1 /DNA_END=481 /DNA_ORIENTATION=-